MPTYEYECDNCQHRFDEMQSFKAEPLKDCPKCGQPTLRRLIGTGAGIIFKGSGFYQTDYRSESYKQAAKADQASSTAATDKGATTTTPPTTPSTPASGGGSKENASGAGKSDK